MPSEPPHFEVFPQMKRGLTPYCSGSIPRQKLVTYATGKYGWRFRDAEGNVTFEARRYFATRGDARDALRQFLTTVGADHEDIYVTPPILDVED